MRENLLQQFKKNKLIMIKLWKLQPGMDFLQAATWVVGIKSEHGFFFL
jgi:hypothetical protein